MGKPNGGESGVNKGVIMDKAEERQLNEIEKYKLEIEKTNSNKRKNQLQRCIKRLRRELTEYRQLRYGSIDNKN